MKDSVVHQEPSAFSNPRDANDNKHYKNYILCITESVTVHASAEDNGNVICDSLYDWRQKWKMTVVCKELCEIKKVIQVTKYVALSDKRERAIVLTTD